MRWIPLQNINSRKWVLCVLYDDCMSYDVTLKASQPVQRILSYASYLNDRATDNIDPATLVRLQKLKKRIIDKHSD